MLRVLFLICFTLSVGHHAYGIEQSSLFQNSNRISIQYQGDTLVYTNNRNLKYFEQLRNHYNGISSEDILNDLLKKQEYIEVLNFLWSEKDQNLRISWLEKKISEGHPILYSELALEYILRDPSIHTYLFFSCPLLEVAAFLTDIDSQCTTDQSVSAASGFIHHQYGNLIYEHLMNKNSIESLKAYYKDHYVEFKNNRIKLLREALNPFVDPKKCSKLPSPRWVFSHGMRAFTNEIDSAAYPEGKWNEIRRKAAQEYLEAILEDENKFKQDPKGYARNVFQNID